MLRCSAKSSLLRVLNSQTLLPAIHSVLPILPSSTSAISTLPTFISRKSFNSHKRRRKLSGNDFITEPTKPSKVYYDDPWPSYLLARAQDLALGEHYFHPKSRHRQEEIMTEPSSSNHGGQQGGKKKHGQSSKGSGSGGGGGSSKLRGLPKDSEDVRISKTLSWVLRHGAQKESLYMRKDGYVRVKDLLGSPRFATVDFEKLEQMVKTDKKNRYDLRYEPDLLSGSVASIWWIRANQGHSMKNVTDLELTPVHAVEDIPTGIVVHGTTRQAWEQIQKEGLSKMTRIHIHFAQGLLGPGIISGMRDSAKVLIYINVQKALDAGLKFFIAKNGAVLSPGDDKGFIKPEFFDKVVSRDGTPMPGFIPSCTSSSSTIPGDVSTSAKSPVVSDPDTQTVATTPASGPAKS